MPIYAPTITAPTADGQVVAGQNYNVTWTYNGDTIQISYRMIVYNMNNTVLYDTGIITSSASTALIPSLTLTNGGTFKIEVTTTSSEGSVTSNSVVFTTFSNPALTLDSGLGSIDLRILELNNFPEKLDFLSDSVIAGRANGINVSSSVGSATLLNGIQTFTTAATGGKLETTSTTLSDAQKNTSVGDVIYSCAFVKSASASVGLLSRVNSGTLTNLSNHSGSGSFQLLSSMLTTTSANFTYPSTIRISASDQDWRSIAYGNLTFVALSVGGQVMTSTDNGVTWISRTAATANQWRGITFGNGLFVGVSDTGTGNRVMTSPDGVTWTARASAVDSNWIAVTFGNGLFVAVAEAGAGNRVMTSPDGVTWTARTAASASAWFSIAYGAGVFTAISLSGAGSDAMTSPDGITWTLRTTPSTNSWRAVTFGNGLFVAVSFTGTTNRAMTSPDGITWTLRTTPNLNYLGIVFGDGLFFAVANSGTGNRIMTSPDGITWTARTSAADNSWQDTTYGNSTFVTVSNSGTGNRVMTMPHPNTLAEYITVGIQDNRTSAWSPIEFYGMHQFNLTKLNISGGIPSKANLDTMMTDYYTARTPTGYFKFGTNVFSPRIDQAYEFKFDYVSAQSKPIKNYQMYLYLASNLLTPISTSGVKYPVNLTIPYTTGSIYHIFDGLLSGTKYAIKCVVETQSGTIVESIITSFSVSYIVPTATPTLIATTNNKNGSITLNWEALSQKVGFVSPAPVYAIGKFNNGLSLGVNQNIYWDSATTPFTPISPQSFTLSGFFKIDNGFKGGSNNNGIVSHTFNTLIEFGDDPNNNMRVFYDSVEKRFGFQYGNYITKGRKHPLIDSTVFVFVGVRDKSVYIKYNASGVKSELIRI